MGKYRDIFDRAVEDALQVFDDPSSFADTVRDIYDYAKEREDQDEEEEQ